MKSPLESPIYEGKRLERASEAASMEFLQRFGIVRHALHLLLREVTKRPLVAAAATSNGASLRVLQKCGFVVERVRLSPASDRFPECEETILVLR